MKQTKIYLLLVLLMFASGLLRADSIYTDDAKWYGRVSALARDTITLQEGCNSGAEKTLRWQEIRYLVFDNKCSGDNILPGGFGRDDDSGICNGDKATFLRIDFDHPSDEPFIFARVIETIRDDNVRIETAQRGVVTGPRSRIKSISVTTKCSSDPLLRKGSLPREYK